MSRVNALRARTGLIAALVCVRPLMPAHAQLLPRQTIAEKRLEKTCGHRLDAYVENPFKYPLTIDATPSIKTLYVTVYPDKYFALAPIKRFHIMRDIACEYAGGRMVKKYWYDYSVVDYNNEKVIDFFSADALWPKSGIYK